MAGAFYAAPSSFGPVFEHPRLNGPVGIAAGPADLLITEYCSQNLDSIDCSGSSRYWARFRLGYLTVRKESWLLLRRYPRMPGLPREMFLSCKALRSTSFQAECSHCSLAIAGAPEDEPGITFDHEGTLVTT